MGSYLAVAAASETNPPYFIHLCYKPPGGDVKRKLALIGKGITFDRFIYICYFQVLTLNNCYSFATGNQQRIKIMSHDSHISYFECSIHLCL